MHKLELWEVWHKIDETSPLHRNLNLLKLVYVQVKLFDTAYKVEASRHHEFATRNLRVGLKFSEIITADVERKVPITWLDHSRLDVLEPELDPATAPPRRSEVTAGAPAQLGPSSGEDADGVPDGGRAHFSLGLLEV
eukprot:3151195-Prymnesium_polylepis.1